MRRCFRLDCPGKILADRSWSSLPDRCPGGTFPGSSERQSGTDHRKLHRCFIGFSIGMFQPALELAYFPGAPSMASHATVADASGLLLTILSGLQGIVEFPGSASTVINRASRPNSFSKYLDLRFAD